VLRYNEATEPNDAIRDWKRHSLCLWSNCDTTTPDTAFAMVWARVLGTALMAREIGGA
jgi:hypothetical protein